jgi:hypothetical protein
MTRFLKPTQAVGLSFFPFPISSICDLQNTNNDEILADIFCAIAGLVDPCQFL